MILWHFHRLDQMATNELFHNVKSYGFNNRITLNEKVTDFWRKIDKKCHEFLRNVFWIDDVIC